MKVLIKRRVISVIMALMMVVTLVPLSGVDTKADVNFYYSKQPQSGEVAGSEKLTVTWDNNFAPDYMEVWRDRSSVSDLEDELYKYSYNTNDFNKFELPSSDYYYYIKTYYTVKSSNGTRHVSVKSNNFFIKQIGAFSQQPVGGEVTGSNVYDVKWKLNFKPNYLEIFRDRSKDGKEDILYRYTYSEDNFEHWELPSSEYPYYVVAHYNIDNVDKTVISDRFYIKQVGAFTKQPQASIVAGSENYEVTYKTNYTPNYIEMYRAKSLVSEELSDEIYKHSYSDENFEKWEVPASEYPYYIRAYYTIDGVNYYFQSENFDVNQTAKFTEQPQGGRVEGNETLNVSWATNFDVNYLEVMLDLKSDGPTEDDYVYTHTYSDFQGLELPYSKYPYYIKAYYSVDGRNYWVNSESFRIVQGADFIKQPESCEVAGAQTYEVTYKTSFEPNYIEVWKDKSSQQDMEDSLYNHSYRSDEFERWNLPASEYPYYIMAYYNIDGKQYSVRSDNFYVKQTAKMEIEPQDCDVAGGEMATLTYALNFEPDYCEVYKEDNPNTNYRYSYSQSNASTWDLPASECGYYFKFHYKIDNIDYSVKSRVFYVNQTARYDKQPVGGDVAGSEKMLVEWKANFEPNYMEIYLDRSSDNLEDTLYKYSYSDFDSYSLFAKKYPYYIVLQYSIDGINYKVRSNNFYINQTAAFDKQPEDGAVMGDEKYTATWKANFEPNYMEIYSQMSAGGNPDLKDSLYGHGYSGFEEYIIQSSDYPYYIVLYYSIDNERFGVRSESFNVTRGEAFLVKPKDVDVIEADSATINWSTNFKPDKFEIWSDLSGVKTEDGQKKDDVKLDTLNKPEKEVEYTFATCDTLYYILAYYIANGKTATIRSNSFTVTKHVHELETVKGVKATCTSKGRKAYYKCKKCGNCYEDKQATAKIDDFTKLDTAIIDHKYKKDITKAKYGTNGKIVTYCSECKGKETYTTQSIAYPKTIELNAKSFVYTGKQITPKVVNVKDIKGVVIPASNYTVSYSDNINVGNKATVKITFKSTSSKYTGSMSTTFEITQAGNSITATAAYTKTAQAKAQTFKLNAKAKSGKVTYKSNNSNVKVDSTGKVTITKNYSGVATITLTAGNRNYKSVTKKITITVIPATTSIKSIVNNVAKKAKVIWNKLTYTSGYQLQYSTNSSFASGNKTVNVKGGASYNTLVSNLVKGKTYYFRIRTYKVISGKNVFSTWSGKKSVKITK